MKINKPHIVLDTNILLVAAPKSSKYRWVMEVFLDEKFYLHISNDILTEYEEKLTELYNPVVAENTINSILYAPNTFETTSFYHWELITADPDDNKFVDCAIAANADYLITDDKHFNILSDIDFPRVNIITLEEFAQVMGQN